MEVSRFLHRRLAVVLFATFAIQAVSVASTAQTASTRPDQQKPAAPTQPSPQRPVRVIADLSQFQIDQPQRSTMSQMGAGSRGAVSALTLCAPAAGTASAARPIFEWRTPDSAPASAAGPGITFSLLNLDGDVIYENDVTGTRLEYPADAPALEPGKTYFWKVSGGELTRLPDLVSVTILSTTRRDDLEATAASTSDPLARAQVYIKSGLWYDSVAALETAIDAHPERKDLPEQLTRLFLQVAPACVKSSAGHP